MSRSPTHAYFQGILLEPKDGEVRAGNVAGLSFFLRQGCIGGGWAPLGRIKAGEGERLGAREFRSDIHEKGWGPGRAGSHGLGLGTQVLGEERGGVPLEKSTQGSIRGLRRSLGRSDP